MTNNVNISNFTLVEEISNYWSNEDFINLLEHFNFPDARTIKPENLRGMLYMAIDDFEPNEDAAIVLSYRLSESLSEGANKSDLQRHAFGQSFRGISSNRVALSLV